MDMSKALHSLDRTAVRSDSLFGRYLIVETAVKANELLVEELPFVYGPKCNGPVVCLECYKPLKLVDGAKCQLCPMCNWPLCKDCSNTGAKYHRRWECSVFCEAKVKFYHLKCNGNECPQLDCITILR